MSAFTALLVRELKLATRASGDVLTLILFFVMVGTITPFAIGPDKVLLARLAPGIIWIAAFLASLLAMDRLFRADHEDGSLLAMRHAALSMEAITLAKLIAHWLTTAVPLIIATPLMAVMLNMDMTIFWRTIVSLALGTPALTAFGAVGAAVTVSLRRGGLIAPVLIMPLSIPILIFGVSAINANAGPGAEMAAMLFLGGISLVATAFVPFAAALALKLTQE